MEMKWIIVYVGMAYVMVIGSIAQAVIVLVMDSFVAERKVSPLLSDLIKVGHLFVLFILLAYIIGPVLSYTSRLGAHNNVSSMIFACAVFVFIALALFLLRRLNYILGKRPDREEE